MRRSTWLRPSFGAFPRHFGLARGPVRQRWARRATTPTHSLYGNQWPGLTGFLFPGLVCSPLPLADSPLNYGYDFYDRVGVARPDGGPSGAYKHGVCRGLRNLYGLHPFKRTRNNCFG